MLYSKNETNHPYVRYCCSSDWRGITSSVVWSLIFVLNNCGTRLSTLIRLDYLKHSNLVWHYGVSPTFLKIYNHRWCRCFLNPKKHSCNCKCLVYDENANINSVETSGCSFPPLKIYLSNLNNIILKNNRQITIFL